VAAESFIFLGMELISDIGAKCKASHKNKFRFCSKPRG
jgi:hypothetical protein